jgi:hypothetical protein
MNALPGKGFEEQPGRNLRRQWYIRPWIWAWALSLFIAAVSCGPVLSGYFHTPEGMVYLGTGECQSDQITYYAKMWPGYRGEWLSLNRYSSEPHRPVLWYPFYVGVGHLARILGTLYQGLTGSELPVSVGFPLTYHVVRGALVVVLFLSLYGLTGQVFRRPAHRFWTMGFAAFAGGWFQGNGIMEAHTLQACFFMPHFVMGQLLYVWTLWGFRLAARRSASPWAPLALCAVGGGGLGWVHPFDLFPLLAIGVLFFVSLWIVRKRFPMWLFLSGCAFALSASIPVFYMQFVLMQIPMFDWMSQNNVLFWENAGQCFQVLDLYLVGAWVLGVSASWVHRRKTGSLFVGAWVVAGTVALYMPTHFQRRFIEGLPIGLAFAWTLGLETWGVLPRMHRMRKNLKAAGSYYFSKQAQRLRNALFFLAFALLLPRTVCVYNWGCSIARNPLCYEQKSQIRACEWLMRNTDWRAVVWAPGEVANRIPFLAGNRVFAGHWNETMDYPKKGKWTDLLLDRNLDVADFRRIVCDYDVQYLFWTDNLDVSGKNIREYDPESVGEPVYKADGVQIFPVKLKGEAVKRDTYVETPENDPAESVAR